MIGAVREIANRILGRGEATITVPSFDGALKPNQLLEAAQIVLTCEAPEDLEPELDGALARSVLQVDHEPEPTGVVLLGRLVESVTALRMPHSAHRYSVPYIEG